MPVRVYTGRRHDVSVRPPVRSSITSLLWTWYFTNGGTDFSANWQKWSVGQGHESLRFSTSEVKVTSRV